MKITIEITKVVINENWEKHKLNETPLSLHYFFIHA